MSLLSRLNRRFGRYAVPNLTIFLIVGQVLVYVAYQVSPGQAGIDILQAVNLYPSKVLSGEYWRLITFLFAPPGTNVIFAFFFWYLFYLMGTTLEVNWGAFRYNVFLAIGYLASIAFAFGVHFIVGAAGLPATNAFLEGTVFLAFARLYPNFVLYIFFILPIKIRWLAIFQWLSYAALFLFGPWMVKAMVLAAVLNYLLFFGREIWRDARHGHRHMQHHAKTLRSPSRIQHVCHVCGLTSAEAPQTRFRYCSQCDGELCYCPEHLHNHEHVVEGSEESEVGSQGSKTGRT